MVSKYKLRNSKDIKKYNINYNDRLGYIDFILDSNTYYSYHDILRLVTKYINENGSDNFINLIKNEDIKNKIGEIINEGGSGYPQKIVGFFKKND